MCRMRPHHDCECGGLPLSPMFGRAQVRQVNRYVEACIDDTRDPHGQIVIRLTIAASGRVTQARATRDELDDKRLSSCLVRAFARIRFEPFPPSTAPGVLEVPIRFSGP